MLVAFSMSGAMADQLQGTDAVYDPSTKVLSIPSMVIGNTRYFNVQATFPSLQVKSIGSNQPVGGTPGSVSESCTLDKFSLANFNAIQVGTTLNEVTNLFGCTYISGGIYPTQTGGVSQFSSDYTATNYIRLTWQYGFGSAAIMFDANANAVLANSDGSPAKQNFNMYWDAAQ